MFSTCKSVSKEEKKIYWIECVNCCILINFLGNKTGTVVRENIIQLIVTA